MFVFAPNTVTYSINRQMDRFLWTFSPGSKDVLKQLLDCYSIHIFLLENTMYLILEPNFCVILAI